MKLRSSLYIQTLAMLCLYLGLLGTAAFLSFNAKFGIGLESVVNSPLGDRLETIAESVGSQLRATPSANWNDILKTFSKNYKASFYLLSPFMGQIAGDENALPKALTDRLIIPRPRPPMTPGFGSFMGEPVDRPPPMPSDFVSNREPPGTTRGDPLMAHRLQTGPSFPDRPPQMVRMRFVVRTENPNRIWLCTALDLTSPDGSGRHIPGILVASCENIWETSLLFDFRFVATVIGSLLLLSFLFWYPFVYRITAALSDLTKQTERIAEGHFDGRLKIRSNDEIGRLSDAVNTMAARLESFVIGQKRFLGAISHELRTPIARLQMALELLESSAVEEQKGMVADIREEVEEMKNLVAELLAFSKAGLQGTKTKLVPVNVKSIMDEVLPRLEARGAIECNVQEGIQVWADPVLLERTLANILRNSLRYGGEFGPIRVSATQIGPEVSIVVTDRGPGVPPSALQHLGEPFYRPEESRARKFGGVGLGLAIVKSCIEACQGVVAFRNGHAGGFEVELRLKVA